jgi:hypothetical protein
MNAKYCPCFLVYVGCTWPYYSSRDRRRRQRWWPRGAAIATATAWLATSSNAPLKPHRRQKCVNGDSPAHRSWTVPRDHRTGLKDRPNPLTPSKACHHTERPRVLAHTKMNFRSIRCAPVSARIGLVLAFQAWRPRGPFLSKRRRGRQRRSHSCRSRDGWAIRSRDRDHRRWWTRDWHR